MKKIILLILYLFIVSCSNQWQTNEEYLDYLASLAIKYQAKHGKLPIDIEQAIQGTDIILPNRGDLNADPYAYIQIEHTNVFMIRSYGENKNNDKGLADDLDIYYINGEKASREEFISELNKHPVY